MTRPIRRPRRRPITGRRATIPSGGGGSISLADWALQGSALDLDFQNNLAAINQYPVGTSTSQLTLTRATSGYAQSQNGIWTSFASGQFRQTDKGLLVEEARTNQLLWCRDMTNAAWVKGATMTAALTQAGIDGSANSASLLTGGAVTATNTMLQTITLGSAADTYSVFLKRVTGSGVVSISADGTTWTAVTLTTAYQQFQVQQTLANPVCGIQITTNGDQVAADFSMLEGTAPFATSPILTTTVAVTRNADVVTLSSPSIILVTNGGTWFAEWYNLVGAPTATVRRLYRAINGSNTNSMRVSASFKAGATSSDGTNTPVLDSTNSVIVNNVYRLAYASADADEAAAYTASLRATVNTASTSLTLAAGAITVGIGQSGASSEFLNSYLRRLAWFPSRVPNANLLTWAQGSVGP